METLDLHYLCTIIGNLSGIPIRIFEGDTRIFYYSQVYLPRDPMEVYRKEIWKLTDSIGYFATKHFHYYGIVNSRNIRIVIGPTRQISDSPQELRELAFRADVAADEMDAFLSGMRSIIQMPLESVMQMLCTINYILNGEKKSLADISICEDEQAALTDLMARQQTARRLKEPESFPDASKSPHNTLDLEQALLDLIRRGDTEGLRSWLAAAPAIRGGVLAPEQLRQRKNTFIVTATLASRAAIQGGMNVEEAFALSDSYIQRCELLPSPDRVSNLQYRMVFDFAEQVERLRHGKHPTRLALETAGYIRRHMSEAVTVSAIADSLYMSRPYFSRRFKEETGETVTDFILKEKTEEAKRLLRYSDKSFSAISGYLGFSSQSHFTRVFRKYAGCTPGEYREGP